VGGIRSLSRRTVLSFGALAALMCLNGCASRAPRGMRPTALHEAMQPFAPEERLNVGIEIFDPGDISPGAMEAQTTNEQIRKAETHFIPMHLKNTMDASNYWGEIRVVPPGARGVDLIVRGTILRSNGEELRVRIEAEDSQGYLWLTRTYSEAGRTRGFQEAQTASVDPFQNLYNAIANDLAAVRRRMDGFEVKTLRRSTEMAFAAEIVPEAFGNYIRRTPDGKLEVVRLPAEDDPTWRRVEQISVRNEMFFDALHASFEPFYLNMWTSYLEWRSSNLVEQTAIRNANRQGIQQAAAGIVMIATAILLEVSDARGSSTLRDVLIIGGTQVIINGVNISERTGFHEAALRELADSFGSEARMTVVELEGQTIRLTGSVEQQMEQWRDMLRRLHEAETGQFPEGDAGE
jgi:hypothetical protein